MRKHIIFDHRQDFFLVATNIPAYVTPYKGRLVMIVSTLFHAIYVSSTGLGNAVDKVSDDITCPELMAELIGSLTLCANNCVDNCW